jgi:hypothetical protein
MMNRPKRETRLTNFRLTEECRRLLVMIAEKRGISQAAVIESLVREEAERITERELKLAA